MKRFLLILLGLLVLDVGTASAATLQLCVKADRMVQGQPREGSKIVLRAECKRRGNGTPIEVSIGTTDSMGSGQGAVSRQEFDQLQQALLVHTCGDGDLEPLTGEQCDDGGLVSGDGCNALCQIEEGWACQGKGSDCDIVCGDGVIVAPEVCDDGNLTGGDGCSANCRSNETCGNMVIDTLVGEQCDEGDLFDDDGCSSVCRIERCGDGVPQLNEECDDGNATEGDGCDSNCTVSRCGNGITDIAAGEECDDGDVLSNDGCSSTCQAEGCGDGVLQSGEVCDDDNRINGDGCSADCQSDETCGNGITDTATGEECDHGTTNGQYGCSADCAIDGESPSLTGLWQVGWYYAWFGAHVVVVEGDTLVFYQRRGTVNGDQPGQAICERRYAIDSWAPLATNCQPGFNGWGWDDREVPLFVNDRGLYFDVLANDGQDAGNPLRQIVSCPGKSLEQILAGQCVPAPSPSGAFLDGAPVW